MNAPTLQTVPAVELATRCAACGRKLTDAVSQEMGMGPSCRKAHGMEASKLSESLRVLANGLIKSIALEQKGAAVVEKLASLRTLGFGTLADRIMKRLAKVTVTQNDNGTISVTASTKEVRAVLGSIVGAQASGKSVVLANAGEEATVRQVLSDKAPGIVGTGLRGAFVALQGWVAPSDVDMATLEKVATHLARCRHPELVATRLQVSQLVDAANTVDWRPDFMIAEDLYAA